MNNLPMKALSAEQIHTRDIMQVIKKKNGVPKDLQEIQKIKCPEERCRQLLKVTQKKWEEMD